MYRVFEALDELSAIVEEARGVPMTAGCVVPRGDVLELVDDIKDAIPGELDDAQDVLDARDSLLNEAKEHADSTVTGANADRPFITIGGFTNGETTRRAVYASGSGTTTLVFRYQVVAGDRALAGIAYPESQITLDNASLADGVDDPSPLAAKLIADGHRLLSMREQEVNLETAFLELTKGAIGRPGRQAAAET